MYQPELPGLDGSPVAGAGLVVRTPSDRYAALLERHQRLLRRVGQARQRLARLQELLSEQGARVATRVEPLAEQLRRLDQEVHAMFADLLKGRRLAARTRRLVAEVYEQLQAEGVLSPSAPGGNAPDLDGLPEPGMPGDASLPDLPSAALPEQAAKGALRGMFLRLAQALHPDRAGSGSDAGAREEAMKAVNRAYREGDLARLLEIERLWNLSRAPVSSDDDLDRRSAALEETNRILQDQLKALEREHRQLKRSDLGRMVAALQRDPTDGLERYLQDGREEIDRMMRLRDFVRSFRDGRISLDLFLLGPDAEEDDSADPELAAAVSMLASWMHQQAEGRPRPRANRRRARKPSRRTR